MSIKEVVRSFCDERWNIGIIDDGLGVTIGGSNIDVHWVIDEQKNRWFADPFILLFDDNTIDVLCEEMYKPRGKKIGRISKVKINRKNYTIEDVKCLLELDTHLSFPAYYRKDGEVYVYPENSEAGGLILYHYDLEQEMFEPVQQICNEPVTDAIITELFGKRLMFCTKMPNPNGRELCVYEWNEISCKFEQCDTYSFDENVARMSGNFFKFDGNVYRPTQECNMQYGHAVTLQKVKLVQNGLNRSKFEFKEVKRIYSSHPYFRTGCHTFNVFDDQLIAVDALGFDRMWFRKILSFLRIIP